MFKDVANILFISKVTETFTTDNLLWPLACYEIIKEVDVKRAACIIDEGLDVVFQGFTTLFIFQAMMMMAMVVVLMMIFVVVGNLRPGPAQTPVGF